MRASKPQRKASSEQGAYNSTVTRRRELEGTCPLLSCDEERVAGPQHQEDCGGPLVSSPECIPKVGKVP